GSTSTAAVVTPLYLVPRFRPPLRLAHPSLCSLSSNLMGLSVVEVSSPAASCFFSGSLSAGAPSRPSFLPPGSVLSAIAGFRAASAAVSGDAPLPPSASGRLPAKHAPARTSPPPSRPPSRRSLPHLP